MAFLIEQQSGRKRKIELDGRALPRPDGVRWGGSQRMDVTWLPGAADAIAQLFGPKERDMSLAGRWGDMYMVGDNPPCSVKVDGQLLTTAMSAAQLLDIVRAEGSLLRVAYESEVRYGFLADWEYGPFPDGRTLQRVDWTARFEWVSKGAAPSAPAIPNQIGTSTLSNRLSILQQQVDVSFDRLQGTADSIRSIVAEPVAKLRSIVNTCNQVAFSWVQRASTAADAAQATVGLTGEVATSSYDLSGTARAVSFAQAASAQQVGRQVGRVGGLQVDAGLGRTLVVARNCRALTAEARDMAGLADETRAATEAALRDAEPVVVIAQRGEDLRDISLRELGSADAWRDVAALNGLFGSEVAPGTPILIPRRSRDRSLSAR